MYLNSLSSAQELSLSLGLSDTEHTSRPRVCVETHVRTARRDSERRDEATVSS